MHLSIPALFLFFEVSRTANSMSVAGIVLLLAGIFSVRRYFSEARGLDKVVALSNLCFAMPLAAFGAEHLAAAQGISQIVPKFMPWPLFWAYFVGLALVAGSLSIATNIKAFWAGLMFGIMMFLFVAMMDLPGTLASMHNRISWTLMFRELSFGAGGWMIAAAALNGPDERSKRKAFATVGCVIIGFTAVFYGVENFLYPINAPGVPLEKVMPTWIPARLLIGYVTGAILVVGGVGILSMKKARMAATYLGTGFCCWCWWFMARSWSCRSWIRAPPLKLKASTTSLTRCSLREQCWHSPVRWRFRRSLQPVWVLSR